MLYDKTVVNLSKRLIFRLALAALLPFSQQVAVGHFAEHALEHVPVQTLARGEDKGFPSTLCAYHTVFEALQSAVGSAPLQSFVIDNVFEKRSTSPYPLGPTLLVVPASRGPPVSILLS